MENLSLAEIAARNMEGEELAAMWYSRAVEVAICSLSKCPAATAELLFQLEQAYVDVNVEIAEKGGLTVAVPSLEKFPAMIVSVALAELQTKAPNLTAEDLINAIQKACINRVDPTEATHE